VGSNELQFIGWRDGIVKHGPRVISNDRRFGLRRMAGAWSCAELASASGVMTVRTFRGLQAMAAEEKRDARIAGLTLGCIVLACFALSALGMNY
jgi:hypothetical protein